MSTSARQDREFLDHVVGSTALESAIEWISSNMNPDEVFKESILEEWAESNGWTKA